MTRRLGNGRLTTQAASRFLLKRSAQNSGRAKMLSRRHFMNDILGLCSTGLCLAAASPQAIDANKPRPTNYSESALPPYTLPDPLVCEDGTPVADAAMWRKKRRPELLRLFESEIYGKALLGRPETMRFVVREEKKNARSGAATRLRVGILFDGREDGPAMELLVYLPNQTKGPVPFIFGLNFDGNYTTTDEPDIPLPNHWVLGLYENEVREGRPTEAGRGIHAKRWQYDMALENGFGVATAGYGEIEPDVDGSRMLGPRALAPEPGPGDWRCIGGWAWACSRALDYLQTHPRIDSKRVAVMGFSRLGKAAMWAAAQDERFAVAISNNSGAGGVALSRRIYGETVFDLTSRFPHWFCANYAKYNGKENECPVDQHELVALIAPRPVLINSAADDRWSDPKGEFLSAVAADPVYRFLGVDGMATKTWPEPLNPVNRRLGYCLRPGRHDITDADWRTIITFSKKWL